MDRLKESPLTLLIIVGVILCCALTAFMGLRPNDRQAVSAPLSEVALNSEDLASQAFRWEGKTSNCYKYLFFEVDPNDINQTPFECYQTKFSTADNSIILLNAIWVFDHPTKAEKLLNTFIETTPSADNVQHAIIDVPVLLGSRSSASTTIVKDNISPFFVTDLYWLQGNSVVRLSIISNKNFTPLNEILMAARRIDIRLSYR